MRKLFVKSISKTVELTGEEHHHLSRVLRCRAGDEITLSNGDGFDYIYTVEKITKTATVLKQISKLINNSEPKIKVALFSSILKGNKNELVVRSCTELGVCEFHPIVTEFTVGNAESYNAGRMQKIALEASKQSGRGIVPEVFKPVSFNDMLTHLKLFDLIVFPYELEKNSVIKDFLRVEFLAKEHKKVAVIVGGEGGFSKAEAEILKSAAVTPLTLGNRILRADTAAMAVCAAVLYEADEMK